MKGSNYKSYILALLLLLIAFPSLSQRVKIYSLDSDTIDCGVAISAYRTFYKEKLYDIAQPTWLRVFDECADSSERVYVDGATMYRFYIESTPDGPLREARIDSLMLIYDRRMEHFGGEGNVLGRKGKDLLAYRGSDISQVQQANEMLRTSIEIQGQESQEAVMQLCISSGAVLYKKGHLEQEQLIEDYVRVTGILVKLEKNNSRWRRTRTKINERLLKVGILSCKALNNYYEPLMEQQKNDTAFQETIIYAYSPLECEPSPVFTAASENLYRLAPGPESAHNLALLFIAGNDLQKADFYLKEALKGEDIADETRAQWYYELSVVNNGLEDYCQSIDYAREAIGLKSNFGQAYIGLGDAIISSRKSLGDDFRRRTAYWAAADMYETAASVDPSVSEEARKKLARCVPQYPDKEDIFFSDIREGEAYVVEGCINETTTVRARN
jgi:hypothetical protein